MREKSYLKSAAVLSLGSLAAKGIGAVYRIPLAGLLGAYGAGLYQMAYPLFIALITFTSAGVPAAFSRIVARETILRGEGGGALRAALPLFALLGGAGSLLMCLLAPVMSTLQGEGALLSCYLALAPAVFFVALVALLRGYFQGKCDMVPTAASEVAEQLVKAGMGLLLCGGASSPAQAATYALVAVSCSEAFALLLLAVRAHGAPVRRTLAVRRVTGTSVFLSALPVMVSSALLPLSGMVDSIVVVRLLARHTRRSVALYGLLSGSAAALVNLPASLSYGLAAASVPAVSRARAQGDMAAGQKLALRALLFTLLLALPCAALLLLFARPAVGVLYPHLSAEDGRVLVRLVRLLALSSACLAGVDTLAACLAGLGRAKCAILGILAGVLVKFLLQWLLVPDPALSIVGAAIASGACYPVAFFVDLFYTVKKEKKRSNGHDHHCKPGDEVRRADDARLGGGEGRGQSACAKRAASLRAKFSGSGRPV